MNDFRSSMMGFIDTSVVSREVQGYTPPSSSAAVFPGQVASAAVLKQHARDILDTAIASRWKQHLFNLQGPSDVDAISETIEYVFEAISHFGPASIDLRGVAPSNVNAEQLVAVLRATNPSKAEILGWAHALSIAPEALRRAGLNPDEVLVGLN